MFSLTFRYRARCSGIASLSLGTTEEINPAAFAIVERAPLTLSKAENMMLNLAAVYGTVPPAWARIKRTSGYFSVRPFRIRETAVLVVSKHTSIIDSGNSKCDFSMPEE